MTKLGQARRLLEEAKDLVASGGLLDTATRVKAAGIAGQARALCLGVRGRDAARIAAEAAEFRASIDVAWGDIELGIGSLVGAASGYLTGRQDRDSGRGLAHVARILSAAYSNVGMRERAAQFAVGYLRSLPDADRDILAIAYGVASLASANQPAQLDGFVPKHDPDDYPEPIRSVLRILGQRSGHRDCSAAALAGSLRNLRFVPPDLRLQCALFAANGLLMKGEPALAMKALSELRADLGAGPLADARVAQALGVAAGRLGDAELALRHHLVAWTRFDDLRYRLGSTVLRQALDVQLARSRREALSVAVARSDWRLLLELIEASRLQASLDVLGSVEELDAVLRAGVYRERPRPATGGVQVVDPDALPKLYQLALGDILGARSDVSDRVDVHVGGRSVIAEARAADGVTGSCPRLDAESVLSGHGLADGLWWSSWCEGGAIYWVLARDAVPIEGGSIRIEDDQALCHALSVASLQHQIEPRWSVPASVAEVDASRYLIVADEIEELELTAPLGRLLPPAALKVSAGRLLMSVAPELAPVPWPILPVDLAASPVSRLIEHVEMQFIPPIAVLGQVEPAEHAGDRAAYPLVMICDYFPTPEGPGRLPEKRAGVTFAAREQLVAGTGVQEATTLNVLRFLRSVRPGADGVAFFRAHYEWVDGDPGSCGISLADGTLPSGLFGVLDPETGRTVFGLPRTVVMSCCSTSGTRERNGGETLGLAPLAMRAGARYLLVTSVDIMHTGFTVALDDMLIETATRVPNHSAALRRLQLRLLDEWRRYSMWDVEELRNRTPLPDIWAHYQAYGV